MCVAVDENSVEASLNDIGSGEVRERHSGRHALKVWRRPMAKSHRGRKRGYVGADCVCVGHSAWALCWRRFSGKPPVATSDMCWGW